MDESEPEAQIKTKKTPKRGIIYLSSIPPFMNVTQIREYFGDFGKLGRVYLQLANTGRQASAETKQKKSKIRKKFTEGWIEFERKSTAKRIALRLNNTQVSNQKKSRHFDILWNIKYLSNFKWTHLHERLAYEKAARRQKLRAEIQLAKKKTNFFTINVDKAKKKKTNTNKDLQSTPTNNENNSTTMKPDQVNRDEFLKTLFQ